MAKELTMEEKMELLRQEWIADGETDFTDDDLREGVRCWESYKEQNKYTRSATDKKEKKPKERKVDSEKLEILNIIGDTLEDVGIQFERETETKLHFLYNGTSYTLNLIKHRAKK